MIDYIKIAREYESAYEGGHQDYLFTEDKIKQLCTRVAQEAREMALNECWHIAKPLPILNPESDYEKECHDIRALIANRIRELK